MNVTSQEVQDVTIAYEPVWAIGTGDIDKVDDAVQCIRIIRKQVEAMFGKKAAAEVRVLYGGSVNGEDAGSYLVAEGIDGLLIGGASLNADTFAGIVNRAYELETR